ncbi:hypothetical protein KY285_023646 [Solanum tuberosum]|nr:hypothetical protein KY289_023975 [Solanum tuberosum]KAH0675845.1 hypothetical protein KY285_023646 [Solanum tuberosum]
MGLVEAIPVRDLQPFVLGMLMAEARAIQGGIQHCIEQQRVPILIESDSLAIINMTKGKWEAPWKIRMEITSTETVQYQNFQSLPSEARKLLPQLRFSTYRNREPD